MTTARKFGIDFVGDIPWATHLCQFYETKHDLTEILVPYFAEGLRSNEACMWVTSEPLEEEEAAAALERAVPDMNRFIERGQLLILPYTEWHFKGGTFDADRVMKGWLEKEQEALHRGFEGLRLAGNTFWIERELWDTFTDYEEAVNDALEGHRIIAVCPYSLEKCSGSDIVDVIRNHGGTIIKKGATWLVVEDVVHRKEAEVALQRAHDELERKVEERTRELQNEIEERKQAETEVARRSKMLDLAHDAIMILDMDGCITYWNQGAERLYGWKEREVLGMTTHELLQATFPDSRDVAMQSLYRDGAWKGELIHTTRDNTRLIIESHWTLYRDSDGKPLAIFEINNDITEQKKAEENAERLAKFPEENPCPVMRLSAEGDILYVNKPGQKLLVDWNGNAGGTAPQPLRDAAIDALSNQEHKTIEVEVNTRVYDFFVAPIIGVRYVNFYGRDVTERKQAETEVARRSKMLDLAHDAIMIRDMDSCITYWNQGAERLYGWKEGEVLGIVTHDLFQTAFPEPLNVIMQSLYRDGAWKGELIHTTQDNARIVVESRWTLYRDSDGKPLAIFEINKDITEQKKAEEALKQAHDELEKKVQERTRELRNEIEERSIAEENVRKASLYSRSLIEASLDPLVTISAEGKITDVNKATEEATGLSREELIGSDFSSYFTDPEQAKEGYQQVFTEGFVKDYPLAIHHTSGKITDVLYHATLFKNEAGEIQGVFAAARDVTERKRAEEQLRAASLYSRSLIEASLDPLVTISAEGKITDVNKATEEVTGYSREELIGTDFSSYFTDPEQAKEGYQQVFTEGFVKDYPLAIHHTSGRITDVLYNATVYRNEAGETQGVFAAARDVTERKRAEEQLRLTLEELTRSNADLEQFAYVASHDLQEPLRAVVSFMQLFERRYKGQIDEKADKYITHAVSGGQRMQDLINGLLAYSRISARGKTPEPIDSTVVMRKAVHNLHKIITENNAVVTHDSLPEVKVDDVQLLQVFQNLIGNAIKYRSALAPMVHIEAHRAGDCWVFSVSDNGIGVDMKYADRIFTIFQRLHTRKKYEGIGMGLAVCKKIIERHDGNIWVESEVGKGSKFYFTLPV